MTTTTDDLLQQSGSTAAMAAGGQSAAKTAGLVSGAMMRQPEPPKMGDQQRQAPTPVAPPTPVATRTIDPAKATVSGQVDSNLANDGPLAQRARSAAMASANARGLINSTMAVEGAYGATLDAVTPIAQADAAAYNAADSQNVAAQNTASLQDSQTRAAEIEAERQRQFTSSQAATQQGYDLAKMDVNQQYTSTNMNQQQTQDLQKLAVTHGYDVANMTQQQVQELQKMSVAKSIDLEKMAVANGFDVSKMALATKDDLLKMSAQQGYDLTKMAAQQGYDVAKMDKSQLLEFAKMDKQQLLDLTKMDVQFDQTVALNATQMGYQKELAAISNKYGTQSTAFSAAANAINAGAASVNDILANKDISNEGNPSPKQQLIAKVTENARLNANLYSSLAGVDVSSFFTSSTSAAAATLASNVSAATATPTPTAAQVRTPAKTVQPRWNGVEWVDS